MLVKDDETRDDLIKDGLYIIQARKGYRFSIDSILLAGFATLPPGSLVCDLGTGSGVMAILLAQRDETCQIKALELQEELCERALRSIKLNHLQSRIEIVKGDIRAIKDCFVPAQFDLVITNPPFWKAGEGKLPAHPEVALACHELSINLAGIIEAIAYILKPGGHWALAQRASRLDEIMQLAGKQQMPVKRIRTVHSRLDQAAYLVLVEGVKRGKPGVEVLPPLVIYTETGSYTEEIMQLYYGRNG